MEHLLSPETQKCEWEKNFNKVIPQLFPNLKYNPSILFGYSYAISHQLSGMVVIPKVPEKVTSQDIINASEEVQLEIKNVYKSSTQIIKEVKQTIIQWLLKNNISIRNLENALLILQYHPDVLVLRDDENNSTNNQDS